MAGHDHADPLRHAAAATHAVIVYLLAAPARYVPLLTSRDRAAPTVFQPFPAMMRLTSALAACFLLACKAEQEEQPAPASDAPATIAAARVQAGALKQMPWLLGTFRGRGEGTTVQEPFYERYSLADDSTLIVESFKDSTLTGPIDTSRYEARRDSLTNPGTRRYVATVISADSIVFGPLVGVRNGFTWRKGDDTSWIAIITPLSGGAAAQRYYRMVRLK